MKRFRASVLGAALCALVGIFLPAMSAGATSTAGSIAWAQVDASPSGCLSDCVNAPPAGNGVMAYDPASGQLVLFGAAYGAPGNSTWAWNGTSWSQVVGTPGCSPTCADSPPGRSTPGFAYDPATGALILFGGALGGSNDTWALTYQSGTYSWTQIADSSDPGCTNTCTSSPPSVLGTQMAYDTATSQLVLFGGATTAFGTANLNDTWILSSQGGIYSWTQVANGSDPGCTNTCTSSPPGRNVAVMAYDAASQQLIVFGGEMTQGTINGLNDTWSWNGTSWTQLADGNGTNAGCGESRPTANLCPSSPEARIGAGMTFDPALGELVLFGGMDEGAGFLDFTQYNDTWLWDGSTWVQDNVDTGCTDSCTSSPNARDTFAMADDLASNQIVLYGGNNQNDTWAAPAVPVVPQPPTSVAVSVNATNATVSWMPPINTGSSPIASYTATASPGGLSCTTTTTSCTIAGLANNVRYTITVTATNSAGTSDPSAPVSIGPANLAATGADLALPVALSCALGALGCFVVLTSRKHRRGTSF